MRNALRELVRDAWVLPIAAAAAIAYAVVAFLLNLVDVLFDVIVQSQAAQQLSQSEPAFARLFDEPMRVRIGDRVIYLQALLESFVVMLIVLAAAALALRWTTRERPIDLDA
jgi:hypothetical protein